MPASEKRRGTVRKNKRMKGKRGVVIWDDAEGTERDGFRKRAKS